MYYNTVIFYSIFFINHQVNLLINRNVGKMLPIMTSIHYGLEKLWAGHESTDTHSDSYIPCSYKTVLVVWITRCPIIHQKQCHHITVITEYSLLKHTSILSRSGVLPGDFVGVLNLTAGVLATNPGDTDTRCWLTIDDSFPWGVLKLVYSSSDSSSSAAYTPEEGGNPLVPLVLQMLSTRAEKHSIRNINT